MWRTLGGQQVAAVAEQLVGSFPQGGEGQTPSPLGHEAQHHIHRAVVPQALLRLVTCTLRIIPSYRGIGVYGNA